MDSADGETVLDCYVTQKAYLGYIYFGGNAGSIYALSKEVAQWVVRRFGDGSPYWICEHDGLRYVFARRAGEPEGSGRFALVAVQEQWAKNDPRKRRRGPHDGRTGSEVQRPNQADGAAPG